MFLIKSNSNKHNQIVVNFENHWLTLWCPAAFADFREKKRLNARGFVWEYLCSCTGYGPGRSVKRRGKSSSLHSKKIFCLGGAGFLWVTS